MKFENNLLNKDQDDDIEPIYYNSTHRYYNRELVVLENSKSLECLKSIFNYLINEDSDFPGLSFRNVLQSSFDFNGKIGVAQSLRLLNKVIYILPVARLRRKIPNFQWMNPERNGKPDIKFFEYTHVTLISKGRSNKPPIYEWNQEKSIDLDILWRNYIFKNISIISNNPKMSENYLRVQEEQHEIDLLMKQAEQEMLFSNVRRPMYSVI